MEKEPQFKPLKGKKKFWKIVLILALLLSFGSMSSWFGVDLGCRRTSHSSHQVTTTYLDENGNQVQDVKVDEHSNSAGFGYGFLHYSTIGLSWLLVAFAAWQLLKKPKPAEQQFQE
ncbi:MAG: hypothetical protein H6581_14345 [Bacteroidia bacterium]|nr:hypothetical protein [Bacteroidia bacterium]